MNMKLKSIIVLGSAIIATSAVIVPAFADDDTEQTKDLPPKVEDHMSKFQKYFRIHSSRQHKAEMEAEAEFERTKEARSLAAAKAAAKEAEKHTAQEPVQENSQFNQEKTSESNSLLPDEPTTKSDAPSTVATANPES